MPRVRLLSPQQGLEEFERCAAQFVETVRDADPAAPVPTCPGWSLADLVAHAGGTHLWARDSILTGRPGDEPTPPEGAILLDWYVDAAAALAATLRETDPDAPAWNFGPKPRTARFWFRRQAHELAVHLVDALAATGVPATELAGPDGPDGPDGPGEAVALDGVDEVVTMFYPRQIRLGRIPRPARGLALRCGQHAFEIAGEDPPAATVAGPAGAVQLLLWGRVPLDDARLALEGDADAARAVLVAGIVP